MIFRNLLALLGAVSLAAAASHQRQPVRSLDRIQEPDIRTVNHRVNFKSEFDLDFELPHIRRQVRLSLEPNHDILPSNALITSLNPDGTTRSEPIQRHAYKIYKGTAKVWHEDGEWVRVGTARINVRKDGPSPLFDGTFTIWHDNHHVVLKSYYQRTKQILDQPLTWTDKDEYMVVFRDSDLGPVYVNETLQHTELKRDSDEHMCNAKQIETRSQTNTNVLAREVSGSLGVTPITNLFGKRQIDSNPGTGNTGGVDLAATIGSTAGCPSTRKVALVGVATDCNFRGQFDSDEDMQQNVLMAVNSASGAFEGAFNISLAVARLLNMSSPCPSSASPSALWNRECSSDYSITDRLNDFSQWRNTLNDTYSHYTLMTSCTDGSAVGLAWVGTACTPGDPSDTQGNQTVAGANVVALSGGTEWQVLAHETGHTFGAVHDCDQQTCADSEFVASGQCCPLSANSCNANSKYIMNPYTIDGINYFSPCTIGNICSAIGKNSVSTTCLSVNQDVTTVTGAVCGNGIVESGEECDCGDEESCASDSCCDGTTCKFKNGAVCDDANEGCCSNCQFAKGGTVCRSSTSSCDPQEVCSGTSSTCPADVTAPDGQSCSIADAPAHAGQLTCASGQCTSRNLQCISVMGSYTSGSNDTYACDSNTCTMSCGSPAFGANVCYQMQQNLLDGTPCGGGGHCSNGICKGSSTAKEIQNWVNDHKGLTIGVATAVGLLLLSIIVGCCCGCCKRRKNSKRLASPPSGPVGPNVAGWYGPPAYPHHSPPPVGYTGPPPPNMSFYPPPSPGVHAATPLSQHGGADYFSAPVSPIGGHSPHSPFGNAAHDGSWQPSHSPLPSPVGPPPQRLWGSGILGARSPQSGGAPLMPPPPPPPAFFNGGRGGSMRYA